MRKLHALIVKKYTIDPSVFPYLLCTFLFFIEFQQLSFAQPASAIEWQKCIGGSRNDGARDILMNTDGSMVIAGYSHSNDGDVSGHHGSLDSADAWVASLDAAGNVQWQKSIGGLRNDYFNTVIPTRDDAYLCIGYTNSTDGDISFNNGGADFFIVKISKTGTIIWKNTFGGSLSDIANDGVATSDGGYAIIGTTSSSDGDVDCGLPGKASDPWVLKIDAAGNGIWGKCLDYNGGGLADEGYNIFEEADKSLLALATGQSFYDYGSFPWVITGQHKPGILYKIETNTGNAVQVGYIQGDGPYSMCKISNAYFFAHFNSNGYSSPWNCVDQFSIVSTMKLNGGAISSSTFSSSNCASFSDDYLNEVQFVSPHGIVPLTNSSYVALGSYVPLDSVYPFNPIAEDAYTSNLGTFGGSGNDYFTAMIPFPNGNEFIAAGYTNSKDRDVAGNHGATDCWVVKLVNNNRIVGDVFLDKNNNGIKDPGETGFDQGKILSTKSNIIQYAIPDNGHYVSIVSPGTYSTTLVVNRPYYTTTNTGETSVFAGYGQADTINFPVKPIPGVKDHAVSITALEPPRPDRTQEYLLNYFNKGTDTITNQLVYFIKDSRTQFGYAIPAIAGINGDTLSWLISSLPPDSFGTVKFYLKLDPIPLLTINDTLIATGYIDSVSDAAPADNLVLLRQLVKGSFDPNDKLESHGGFITPAEMMNEKYLNYTIRFQNTGNEAAGSIIIRDTLDTKLDVKSFEMISCSHPYRLNILNSTYVTWTFDNINLPDSNSNELLSHGYINYRIQPKPGFVTGDSIRNRAAIFFDFNPPIFTNTQLTVFTAVPAIWTGSVNKLWENPLNWANGKVPDAWTDVYINAGSPNYPEISSNAACRLIHVNKDATIKVNPGFNLNVGGDYIP